MTSFFASLNTFYSPENIRDIARTLEEKETNITQTGAQIIAGLLGITAKQGHTWKVKQTLREAGESNLIADIGMFNSQLIYPQQHIGDRFIHYLLKGDRESFVTIIHKGSNLSITSVNRLLSIIGIHFAALFGKKIVKDGIGLPRIIDEIKDEEETFALLIPAELAQTFQLHTVLGTVSSPVSTHRFSFMAFSRTESEKASWLARLFFMSFSLCMLIGWSSCNSNRTQHANQEEDKYTTTPTTQNEDAWETVVITLPNGKQFTAYKNGVEERMIAFLTSNEYQNSSEAELKKKWFEFDNIDFEFGSITTLKASSENQLNNIITILNAHQDTKIMIYAFTDKEGEENAFTQVSKERAKTIEELLIQKGAVLQLDLIDSINEPYILYSSESPRSEIAKDRGIAIRFVK